MFEVRISGADVERFDNVSSALVRASGLRSIGIYAFVASALVATAVAVSPVAPAAPAGVDVYAWEVGDDNGDGVISEDESGWLCAEMGNRVCGPSNVEGKPAGCYDEGGVLVATWPCEVRVNAGGTSDVFVP